MARVSGRGITRGNGTGRRRKESWTGEEEELEGIRQKRSGERRGATEGEGEGESGKRGRRGSLTKMVLGFVLM
jgi:hypothetical protein